jgi:multiple sugar transport system ATP-binding protein
MATVNIQNIQKNFGAVKVIHGIDIDIADGEFVVLVGPSGCGKSTLLRMIAGLEEVSGGEISIGPRDVSHIPSRDRDIAMVFQNYALYPHMTVEENMGFALKLKKIDPSQIKSKVGRAATILGLEKLLDRYPKQLSGGQRQRVAMGRAIVRDPQVFLFDEPLSNLDAKLRVQMRGELKDMHARFKTTTIYVTHDQIEAMTMADLIVVMRAGVVEQIGSPLELYDFPANMFVASFIGSPAMNFLTGTVRQFDGQQVFETGSGYRLPVQASAGAADGLAATLGIRPEHLSLAPAGQGLGGKIVTIEPTGSETFVVLQLGEDRISALLRQRLTASIGDELWLAPQPDTTHLFDSATSMRLSRA